MYVANEFLNKTYNRKKKFTRIFWDLESSFVLCGELFYEIL